MKLYKCDVCGKLIDPNENGHFDGHSNRYTGYEGSLLRNKDICETCLDVAETLNFEQIMMTAWRTAVHEKQAK